MNMFEVLEIYDAMHNSKYIIDDILCNRIVGLNFTGVDGNTEALEHYFDRHISDNASMILENQYSDELVIIETLVKQLNYYGALEDQDNFNVASILKNIHKIDNLEFAKK